MKLNSYLAISYAHIIHKSESESSVAHSLYAAHLRGERRGWGGGEGYQFPSHKKKRKEKQAPTKTTQRTLRCVLVFFSLASVAMDRRYKMARRASNTFQNMKREREEEVRKRGGDPGYSRPRAKRPAAPATPRMTSLASLAPLPASAFMVGTRRLLSSSWRRESCGDEDARCGLSIGAATPGSLFSWTDCRTACFCSGEAARALVVRPVRAMTSVVLSLIVK